MHNKIKKITILSLIAISSILSFLIFNIVKNKINQSLKNYTISQKSKIPVKIKNFKSSEIISIFPAQIQLNDNTIAFDNQDIPAKTIILSFSPTAIFYNQFEVNEIQIINADFTVANPTIENLLSLPDNKIIIKNSTLQIDKYHFDNLNITIPKITKDPFTLKASATIKFLDANINIEASSLINLNNQNIEAKNSNIKIVIPTHKKDLVISTNFNAQYSKTQRNIKFFDIMTNIVNFNIKGNLDINTDNINVSGTLNTSQFNLHDTFANLDFTMPFKNNAFNKLSLNIKIIDNKAESLLFLDNKNFNIASSMDKTINISSNDSFNLSEYTPQKSSVILDWFIDKILKRYKFTINNKNINLNKYLTLSDILTVITCDNNNINIISNSTNTTNKFNYQASLNKNNFKSMINIKSNNIFAWINGYVNYKLPLNAKGTINISNTADCIFNCASNIVVDLKAKETKINKKIILTNTNAQLNINQDSLKARYQGFYLNHIIKGNVSINLKDQIINGKIKEYIPHPIINKKINTIILYGSLKNIKTKQVNELIIANFTNKIIHSKYLRYFNRD